MMFCRLVAQINVITIKRFLLTKTYPCFELWNERMDGIDCKISANDLNIKLQACLNNDIPISALDFDILMNKTNEVDVMNLNHITKIVKSFRKTQESVKAFDSSAHALIRNFIDMDEPYKALDLIRNRQQTGIFLDDVSVNLLIDKFIAENNWEKAFFTSAEWLLQEDLDASPLSLSMSLACCMHFWNENLWQHKPSVVDVSDLPEEFVFVQYQRCANFDDHFDLVGDQYRRRLLGKCVKILADHIDFGSSEDARYMEHNLRLLGLALHEKVDLLLGHLQKWLSTDEVKLSSPLIESITELIRTSERTCTKGPVVHPTYSEEEVTQFLEKYQDLIQRFRDKGQVEERSLSEVALRFVADRVNEQSEKETESVRQKYSDYRSNRVAVFETTKQKILDRGILENSKKKLLELTEQEELIKYFEQMPQIMYKSWLAKRTKEERLFCLEKDEQENLDNLRKKEKQKFVVQHVLE